VQVRGPQVTFRPLAVLMAVSWSLACSPSPVSPPRGISEPARPAVSPAIMGIWEGSSIVESSSGTLPQCIGPFWRNGFSDRISASIQPLQLPFLPSTTVDMRLHQQASEECHLQVEGSSTTIAAHLWPYDEFDCALVPAVCSLRCHFRLDSTQWGCLGTPPDVWVVDIRFSGTLDVTAARMQGTIEVAYDHRPGGSQAAYVAATVVKRVELAKTPR
jgi:hypothetical protein